MCPHIISSGTSFIVSAAVGVYCGTPIRSSDSGSSKSVVKHPNDLDVTSYLPALTTEEYADMLEDSE